MGSTVDAPGDDLRTYWGHYGVELERARSGISIDSLAALHRLLRDLRERRGRLVVLGNGGSAASASHWVCDFGKGTNTEGGIRFRVISPMDLVPWHSACANDFSFADALAEQLANWLDPDDIVLLLSVSGNSENLIRAANVAHQYGAKVVAIVGAFQGRLVSLSDLCLTIPSYDYGVVEDLQMTINHALTQFFKQSSHAGG